MILIPISTDAPIYHRPIGTVLLIVANVAVYIVTGDDLYEAIHEFGLHHGIGFTPVQWVTSNFIHGGFFHLLGNMIFLWGFGLIVEGKIGWLQFIPLYMGIGVSECILEQILFASADGVSFGASAIIFGLLVIALIWAPQNELSVFYWFFFRFVGVVDMSIVLFAFLNLLMSLAIIVLMHAMQLPSGGEIMHLIGAAIGGVIGLVYLKAKFVDCEGWDILSVMTGNTPSNAQNLSQGFQEANRRRSQTRKAKRNRPFEATAKPKLGKASPAQFHHLLTEQKVTAALTELEKIRHLDPEWSPTSEELLFLARGLRRASKMKEAVMIYQEFLNQKPEFTLAGLELAEIFVFVQERPNAAMKLLKSCDVDSFTEKHRQRHKQATRHAQAMIDDGIIEIDYQ